MKHAIQDSAALCEWPHGMLLSCIYWTRLKSIFHNSFFCMFPISSSCRPGSVVKNPPANAGNMGSISGSGRCPGGGHGNPLQYSCLENPMDRGAWWATVRGVRKRGTWLSDRACTQPWQTEVWIESPKRGPIALNQFPVTHPETLKFRGNHVPLMKRCYYTAKKKKLECKSSSLLVFKCPVVLLPGWKLWGRKNNQTSIRDLQTLTQNLQHFLCPPERARS